MNECKEQLQKKDQELADIKAQLQSVKDTMEELKIWEEKKLQQVTADLEAAKEEIAVKVAQVKQYQKQVEAYKQQLERVHVHIQCACTNIYTLHSCIKHEAHTTAQGK